jgi:WXG100 family type VII secretion target
METMISVELNNLHSVSGKMQNVINSLSNIDLALGSITASMGGIWEGKAKSQYVEDCKELRMAASAFKDEIAKRKQALEQSLAVYERTENTVKGAVSDLSANNIF